MWENGVRIYGTPGVPNNFPKFRNMKAMYVSGEYDDIFWKSNLPHNLKMDHIIYSTKRMQLPIDSKIYDLFHFPITLLDYSH